jgi:glycine cleavage system transcriptional repressor
MREGLIVAAVGPDRPGIVDRISGAIFKLGLNLEDSRMAILGGEFAVVALVGGPAERLSEAKRAIEEICAELRLSVQFRATRVGASGPESRERIPYRLTAVAMDHPGIVHRITHLLAAHEVNVANLETRLGFAPISATPIFSLELEAQVPADLPLARLREALKELSDAENIDLDLKAIG